MNQAMHRLDPERFMVGEPPVALQGVAEPSFKFKGSDFWAQGLNVGLGFRF